MPGFRKAFAGCGKGFVWPYPGREFRIQGRRFLVWGVQGFRASGPVQGMGLGAFWGLWGFGV